MARFRIKEASEVLRDQGGHFHHWTILGGTLEDGELGLYEAVAIPRVGGGEWLGQIIGFEAFGRQLAERVNALEEADRPFGVAVWGVAPPRAGVELGVARVVSPDDARALYEALLASEPERVAHCSDCRRVARYASATGRSGGRL